MMSLRVGSDPAAVPAGNPPLSTSESTRHERRHNGQDLFTELLLSRICNFNWHHHLNTCVIGGQVLPAADLLASS